MDVLVAHGAIDRGLRVQAQRVHRVVLDGDPWLRVRMTYAVDEISWHQEHWSVSLRVRAGDQPEVTQRRELRDRFARHDMKEGQIVCDVPVDGADEVSFTAVVERHMTPWVDDTHRSPRRRAVATGRIAVLHG